MIEEIEKNVRAWDETWSFDDAQAWYPDEQVIRFLARYFCQRTGPGGSLIKRKTRKTKLIGADFGCGPGRHMLAMRQHGIEAHGIDLSPVVTEQANALMKANGFYETAISGSLTDLPYADRTFDLGICHGVLDHMTRLVRQKSVQEITRALRPKAKLLASFISKSDSAFGKGIKIEKDTWMVPEGHEKGIPQAFFEIHKIKELFTSFSIVTTIEVTNNTIEGRSLIGSDKHYDVDARYYLVLEKN